MEANSAGAFTLAAFNECMEKSLRVLRCLYGVHHYALTLWALEASVAKKT
jgi:hypothetical protein